MSLNITGFHESSQMEEDNDMQKEDSLRVLRFLCILCMLFFQLPQGKNEVRS